MLAEIGDISRFANGSRLATTPALGHPPVRSSIRGQTRSRRGNHRLKNAMYLSAFASLRDPVPRAFSTASGPRESTPQPSSASRVVAATSSWPCCARAPYRAERLLVTTSRWLPDAAPGIPDQWRLALDKEHRDTTPGP